MWPDFGRVALVALLPSCAVDTNESLRQRALRLITLGCSQKIVAAKMGMQASTFSRWINQKDEIGPVSVTALDGFNAYVQELAAALGEVPNEIRQSRVSEPDPPRVGHVGTGEKRRGDGLALTVASHEKTHPVPDAAHTAHRQALADIEQFEREGKPQRAKHPVGKSPRAKRAVGEYVAAPRQQKTSRGPRAGKHRR